MCLPVNRAESNPPTHPQGTGARPSFVWPYFGRRAPCAQKNISFSLKKNKKTSKITKKTTKIKKNRALSRAKRANLSDLMLFFTIFSPTTTHFELIFDFFTQNFTSKMCFVLFQLTPPTQTKSTHEQEKAPAPFKWRFWRFGGHLIPRGGNADR